MLHLSREFINFYYSRKQGCFCNYTHPLGVKDNSYSPLANGYTFLKPTKKISDCRNRKEGVIMEQFRVTFDRRELPRKPGVYSLYIYNYNTDTKELQYIGESKNIRRRFENHEVYQYLKNKLMATGVFQHQGILIETYTTEDHKKLEKWLIGIFEPPYNNAKRKVLLLPQEEVI